jgi:hypothetical protein
MHSVGSGYDPLSGYCEGVKKPTPTSTLLTNLVHERLVRSSGRETFFEFLITCTELWLQGSDSFSLTMSLEAAISGPVWRNRREAERAVIVSSV